MLGKLIIGGAVLFLILFLGVRAMWRQSDYFYVTVLDDYVMELCHEYRDYRDYQPISGVVRNGTHVWIRYAGLNYNLTSELDNGTLMRHRQWVVITAYFHKDHPVGEFVLSADVQWVNRTEPVYPTIPGTENETSKPPIQNP